MEFETGVVMNYSRRFLLCDNLHLKSIITRIYGIRLQRFIVARFPAKILITEATFYFVSFNLFFQAISPNNHGRTSVGGGISVSTTSLGI